jgi:hypothetical protein
MNSNLHSKRQGFRGTTLASAFLLTGVIATVFAMIGHELRGEKPSPRIGRFRTVLRSASDDDELRAGTVFVGAVTGAVICAVVWNLHSGGVGMTSLAAIVGLIFGGFTGAALWQKPALLPVLTGCTLILIFSVTIRLRRGLLRAPPPDPYGSRPISESI